jgi:hypothetical protein
VCHRESTIIIQHHNSLDTLPFAAKQLQGHFWASSPAPQEQRSQLFWQYPSLLKMVGCALKWGTAIKYL